MSDENRERVDELGCDALFALLSDLRKEGKEYMAKGNGESSNAPYYCGKSWAYDDAADRLESILKANAKCDGTA